MYWCLTCQQANKWNSTHKDTSTVTSVAIFEDNIISGSYDSTIRVWDLLTGQDVGKPLRGRTSAITSVTVCEGKFISGSWKTLDRTHL